MVVLPAAGGAVNPLGDTRAARVEDEALAAGGVQAAGKPARLEPCRR